MHRTYCISPGRGGVCLPAARIGISGEAQLAAPHHDGTCVYLTRRIFRASTNAPDCILQR